MKYGYCRVPPYAQAREFALETQKQDLMEAGVPEENIVKEQFTGRFDDRPEFQKLISRLQSGDELVCLNLSRFATSMEDGTKTIQQLVDHGVIVNILNLGRIGDGSSKGNLILSIMPVFAQFEKYVINERKSTDKMNDLIKEGKYGRPRIAKMEIHRALDLLVSNSYSQVSDMTGISKSTLIRYERKRKAEERERMKDDPSKKGGQELGEEVSVYGRAPNKRPGRPKKKK